MLSSNQILKERYQLEKLLGKNAGRQTWLARDLQSHSQEHVVLKLLSFGGDVVWEDLKLFEREAQILKQLDHPRIPKYKDYFAIDEQALWFGLAQEYIDGDSLKDLLMQGRKFNEDDIKQIATDILEILIYLHELSPPVLHRDIKPSNLILDKNNQVYLVDFGAVQDKASAEGKTFTVVGTYGYTPMEQFGGRAVPASDLYALGATLIHLLTGISPAELPQDNIRIDFKDYTSVSSRLIAWIEKLTEPAVKQRFNNAYQALEILHGSDEIGYGQSLSTDKNRASTISKVPKLPKTKIEVYSNQEYLKIFIPSKFKASPPLFLGQLALIIAMLGGIGAFLWLTVYSSFLGIIKFSAASSFIPSLVFFIAWFFTIKALPTLSAFKDNFEDVHLYLDRQKFKLKRSRFNRIVSSKVGYTQDIEYVAHSTRMAKSQMYELRSVAFHTIDGEYFLGSILSEDEAAWLAQEIQEWLRTA